MSELLFDSTFLQFRIWDFFDIVVVGILIYQVYRLLRGSVAFNIFVGVVLLYLLWWLVRALKMDLLSLILGQFVNVGVIIVAIIFQPEIRRFLLLLGNQTIRGRLNFLRNTKENSHEKQLAIKELRGALRELGETHTGALIVLANNSTMFRFGDSGIVLRAKISKPLLISIFKKESPLHDGAVIISDFRIHAASCILPLSENPNLPEGTGLRHRAAVGITELANVVAFIVSEETGHISMAIQGNLVMDLDEPLLESLLEEHFG